MGSRVRKAKASVNGSGKRQTSNLPDSLQRINSLAIPVVSDTSPSQQLQISKLLILPFKVNLAMLYLIGSVAIG